MSSISFKVYEIAVDFRSEGRRVDLGERVGDEGAPDTSQASIKDFVD